MNEIAEHLQREIEAQRDREPSPIEALRAAMEEAGRRYSDSLVKAEEFRNEITATEATLRRLRDGLAYQERRAVIQQRIFIGAREVVRGVEDERMGF